MWPMIVAAGIQAATGYLKGRSAQKAAQASSNIQAGQAGENAALARDLPYRLNPYLQQSAEQWGGSVRDVHDQSADYVTQTAGDAAAGARGAAQQGISYMNPYMQAGGQSTQQLLDSAGQLLTAPQEKFQFSEDDPSYQWRLQQGSEALERSAAARGGLASGNTLKALTGYGQGMASTEYQAAFNRFMDQQKFGLDRTRLGYDALSGIAGRGLTASQSAGEFGLTGEKYAGDWMTQGAKTAGDFRGRGAEFQSNAMMDSTDQQIKNIFAGEHAGMGYMTDRATALAGGQVSAANAKNATLSSMVDPFTDLLYSWKPKAKPGTGTVGPSGSGGGFYHE